MAQDHLSEPLSFDPQFERAYDANGFQVMLPGQRLLRDQVHTFDTGLFNAARAENRLTHMPADLSGLSLDALSLLRTAANNIRVPYGLARPAGERIQDEYARRGLDSLGRPIVGAWIADAMLGPVALYEMGAAA